MRFYFNEQDKDLLNEEVTPLETAEYLGLGIKKMGTCYSILCPDPNHDDRHYGSCVISRGGRFCKCYACDKTFTSSQIIELTQGLSFYDTMSLLAKLSGHEADFLANKKGSNGQKPLLKALPVMDRKMLGLNEDALRHIPLYDAYRPQSLEDYDDILEEMQGQARKKTNHRSFLREDPEAYSYMVRLKCEERMIIVAQWIHILHQAFIHMVTDQVSSDDAITDIFCAWKSAKDMFIELHSLYTRYGGMHKTIKNMAKDLSTQFRQYLFEESEEDNYEK